LESILAWLFSLCAVKNTALEVRWCKKVPPFDRKEEETTLGLVDDQELCIVNLLNVIQGK